MFSTFKKEVNLIVSAQAVEIVDFKDKMIIKEDLKDCDLCHNPFEKGFLFKYCNHVICNICFQKMKGGSNCFCREEIESIIQIGKYKRILGIKSAVLNKCVFCKETIMENVEFARDLPTVCIGCSSVNYCDFAFRCSNSNCNQKFKHKSTHDSHRIKCDQERIREEIEAERRRNFEESFNIVSRQNENTESVLSENLERELAQININEETKENL